MRSADEWVALRKLRNRMMHEYLWQYPDLHGALMAAQEGVDALSHAAQRLTAKVRALELWLLTRQQRLAVAQKIVQMVGNDVHGNG